MKKWWNARTRREQTWLASAIVVVVALTVYNAVYRPVSAFQAEARQAHQEAMAYLADVEVAVRNIRNARATANTRTPLGEGGLRAAGTDVAAEVGVVISRLQPLEQGGVEFWVDSASAQQVFRWLTALHQRHGIVVRKADIRQAERGENVRAQVALAVEPAP